MGGVTLQTIADHLDMSRMTVSNAFSRPDQLSATLRGRVLAVADELGYAGPDPTARALASGTGGTVGVLLCETLTYAPTDELAPTGLALTLLSAAPQGGVVPARDVAVEGAIVYCCNPDSTAVGSLMRRRLPLGFVDQAPASGIGHQDRRPARRPSRRPAHHRPGTSTCRDRNRRLRRRVRGPDRSPRGNHRVHQAARLLGWLDVLGAAGIEPTVVRQRHTNPEDIGYTATQTLLEHGNRPTAIFCSSDAMARAVIRAVQDRGLHEPDDVSVVGFDDNPIGRRTRPALTTVRQDVDAKGRAAAAALTIAIDRAKTRPVSRGQHLVLPTELVVSDGTTRAAPDSSIATARGASGRKPL
jgi:DNA-binding LacI/PurR family transcriptional regulator